jgi:CubicO group peptidase (beta-lactamase class C family)
MSLLVDDNEKYPQVQWDTPVSQLIRDDFVLEDEYVTNHVTVEDTLTHRTGLPRHDQAYGGTYDGHKATVKDIVRSMRHLPLTAEIRARFQYCNLMFVVASHIIETLTGEWLGDLMAQRIWKPLGMTGTFFSKEDAIRAKEDLARGYYFEDGSYQNVPWMPLDGVSGAGSVISNAVDYCKWARALMKRAEGLPLSKSGFKEIWRARTLLPEDAPFTGSLAYALGWGCGVYRGHRFFEHTGGMDAFGTDLIIFPDINFSVVAFANTAGTSNFLEKTLIFHLIDERLKVPVAERFDWNKK